MRSYTNEKRSCIQSGEAVGHNDYIWNGLRQILVYEGLLAKFSQNKTLKAQRLATDTAALAECAVKDRIWGIGLAMDDPDRFF